MSDSPRGQKEIPQGLGGSSHSPSASGAGERVASEVRPATGHRNWSADPASTVRTSKPGLERRRWYFQALSGLGLTSLLTVGFVWLLAMPQARFPLLVLVETEYQYPVPPNPWGAEDWGGFQEFARRPQAAFRIVEPPRKSEGVTEGFLERLQVAWEGLKQSQNDRSAVVGVYLAAHGHVDENNQPYLLPGNAKLDDRGTWVPVRDVLSVFQSDPQEVSGRPNSFRVILFLDGSKAPVPGEQGLSHRSFSNAVKSLVDRDKRGDPEIWLSADESQRSLTGQEFGGSLFARCLMVGLAGAADQPAKQNRFSSSTSPLVSCGDGSGQVELGELRRFLEENIPRMAWNVRGLPQTPVFIGSHDSGESNTPSGGATSRSTGEVPLTRAESGKIWREVWSAGLPSSGTSDPEAIIEGELASAWCELEQRCHWAGHKDRVAAVPAVEPLKLTRLRGRLLWAEQALEGGPALLAQASSVVMECRAELQRSQGDEALGATKMPSVEKGLELAMKRAAPANSTGAQLAIEVLKEVARAADRAWGTDSPQSSDSVPPDPRAFLPFLERLSQLDSQRRILEDLHWRLLNPFSSAANAESREDMDSDLMSQGEDLAAAYSQLSEMRDRFARGLAASETVLALGPYFARWHETWPAGLKGERNDLPVEKFERIWQMAWALRSQLADCPNQSQIESRQAEFDRLLAELQGSDPADVSKRGLWQELSDLTRRIIQDNVAVETEDEAAQRRRECAILQSVLESGFPCDPTGGCATEGVSKRRQLRKRWQERRRELAEPKDWTGETPAVGNREDPLAARLRRVLVSSGDRPHDDRLTALLAAQPWGISPRLDDPPDKAQLQSLHRAAWEHLRAISQREIHDFWPLAGGVAAGFQRLQPVWNQQTRLQDQMSSRECALTGSPQNATKDDQEQLKRAEALFARRLRLKGPEIRDVPPGFPQDLQFQLDPGGTPWEFPRARMGLRLVTGDGMVVSEATIASPEDGTEPPPQSIRLSGDEMIPQKALLEYRGWRRTFSLSPQKTLSTFSQWRRSDVGQPTVQVRLGSGPREDLLLVLDCSTSMASEVSQEGSEGPATRFEAAREALQTLLEGFLDNDGMRVGVWLIGHRVAWSRREPGKLLRQTDYSGGIPEDVLPSADVESILPLGRFDSAALELVNRRLATVRPWGETPLHLALYRAVKEQSKSSQTSIRRIIAVTDGINYQFNPSPDANIALSDLVDQALSADVQISVIGFALDRSSEKEYEQLERNNGWQYVPARRSADLLPRLRTLTQPREFLVRDLDSGRIGRSPLGVPIEVRRESDTAISIDIDGQRDNERLANTSQTLVPRVNVRGEEAIELVLDPGTNLAKSAVFSDRNPSFSALVSGDSSNSPKELGVHVPERDGERVEFLFSLRSPEGQVVECPQRFWIEVTPLVGLGSQTTPAAVGLTQVFQDVEIVPRTPNPVFRIICGNWPERGTAARIQFWMGDNPGVSWLVDPDEPVQDVGTGMERVVWRETVCPQQQPALVVAPDHAVSRSIQRVFVPELCQVRHEFFVEKTAERPVKLRISDSRPWKSSAMTLALPVEIAVPRSARNLRPTTVRP